MANRKDVADDDKPMTKNEMLARLARELEDEVPSDTYVHTSDEDVEIEQNRTAELKKAQKPVDAEFVIMDELKKVVHKGSTTSFRVKKSVR